MESAAVAAVEECGGGVSGELVAAARALGGAGG